MPEELEHVRRPSLPWRDDELTECGKPITGRRAVTRDEMIAKVKRQGQARAAMTSCMTCWQTAKRWQTWEQSPADVMRRYVPDWHEAETRGDKAQRLDAELRAIAALVEAHRDEFDGYMTGLAEATDLGQARTARARKQARLR